MSDTNEYLLRWRGREQGPFPLEEINRKLDDHQIGLGHEILYDEEWISLEQFFSLTRKSAPPPSPPQATASAAAPATQTLPAARIQSAQPKMQVKAELAPVTATGRPRQRLIFALLGLVAGFVGAHNFYARQWLTGMLQLLLSIATYLMGFGIIASWLWAMGEAVLARKDGDGIEMI